MSMNRVWSGGRVSGIKDFSSTFFVQFEFFHVFITL